MTANKQTTPSSSLIATSESLDAPIVQNFHLVWLHGNIDDMNDQHFRSIMQLRELINTINIFTDIDRCIDFITDNNEAAFVIISGITSQMLISIMEDIVQVSSVYIFCETMSQSEKCLNECPNVSSVYTDVTRLCEALKQATEHYNDKTSFISFAKTAEAGNESTNTLQCSFMYTLMLKDILLTIDFDDGHFKEFLVYCRKVLAGNSRELQKVDRLEKEYDCTQAIWWYTYESFLYSMVNKALRTMEADLIVTTGFFVRDLHNQITKLHVEQYSGQNHSQPFVVYRGQSLSRGDFDELVKNQGGLLAFNNFLSTSLHRDVSLRFLRRSIGKSNQVGVLFVLKIDPSLPGIMFANIRGVSCHSGEEEILFSMHTVFRVEQVHQIEPDSCLWEVNLTLTKENDPELHALGKSITNERGASTGWYGLASLLLNLAQFDKAEQIFQTILSQTPTDIQKANV